MKRYVHEPSPIDMLQSLKNCNDVDIESSEDIIEEDEEFEEDDDDYDYYGEDTYGWEKMSRKWVEDYDGFLTDYTLWYNSRTDEWCTVFGDNDIYHPWDSDHDMDFENNEEEARSWFDTYRTDDDDDDFE